MTTRRGCPGKSPSRLPGSNPSNHKRPSPTSIVHHGSLTKNRIRPVALGRNNWLFAGSLRAGKRAAAIMSLIHSARMNGRDPYANLRDVLERPPTQPASRIGELLPHRWQAAA